MNDEPITEASLLAQLEQARGRIKELESSQAGDTDEFNAGFDAAQRGENCDQAEATYRQTHKHDYDSFAIGYAWAMWTSGKIMIAERAAALCQSCPLLAGSADLLGVINALRLQRMEAESSDELHKRAAVTLGKFYLSAQTRQALDDVRTCEYEV